MKKLLSVIAVMAMVLALAAPVFAQQTGDDAFYPVPEEPNGGELPGGGDDEEPVVSDREPTQAEGDDAAELADTGVDAATLATVALGLLLAGGVGLVAARRAGRHG